MICDYCSTKIAGSYTIRGDQRPRYACSDCGKVLQERDERFEQLKASFSVSTNPKRRRGPHFITEEQYDELVDTQSGRCAICAKVKFLHIDHDHSCGCPGNGGCPKCIRGLLCAGCNTAIGKLGDTVEGLKRAVAYLESVRPLAVED